MNLAIIAAIIYVIIKFIMKVQVQQNAQPQGQGSAQTNSQGGLGEKLGKLAESVEETISEVFEDEKPAQKKFEGTMRPNSEGYREPRIGEKLKKEPLNRGTFVSTEGTASTEGECIEENPDHCAVEHEDNAIYGNEIGSEKRFNVSHKTLVNGVIMAEIISKPKCFK